MIVELSADVVRLALADNEPGASSASADLSMLINLVRHRGHAIRTRPAFRRDGDQPINDWLAQQSQTLRASLELVLVGGVKKVSNERVTRKVHVCVEDRQDIQWPASDSDVEILFPLGPHVLRFLQRPLALMLEDHHSDWAFLRLFATSSGFAGDITPDEGRDRAHLGRT